MNDTTSGTSGATNDEALRDIQVQGRLCGNAKISRKDLEQAAPVPETPRPVCNRWISCVSAWRTEEKATMGAGLISLCASRMAAILGSILVPLQILADIPA
jgi:hypothetical protein